MYKAKVCGVDIRVGDVLEDSSGNACIVYKLWRLSDRGAIIINFYWISCRRSMYNDCATDRSFPTVFKKKLKI